MIIRKTKIVCTLGPSTDKGDTLEQLIKEGMNVARFNFSHGSHEEQKKRLTKLKLLREQYDKPVAALLDTKGPEIRIGTFKDGQIKLKEGQLFTLTTGNIEGDETKVSQSYKNLCKDVFVGSPILIDDGLIEMIVEEINGSDIVCRVKNSGKLSNRKGVNAPGVNLSMDYLSKKDESDILFGIQEDFDFIAASFTRTKKDVLDIRNLLDNNGGKEIRIIAKIENQQGVENINEILEVADGIMIARGDMGVEIPLEDVPIIQQKLIKKVYNSGKQVITATQMLDSMIINPRPTRAEANDVANAIYQGTSAIMLSGETASGKYPVEALKTMNKIALRMEHNIDYNDNFRKLKKQNNPDVTNAISHACCMTAIDLKAKAIVTVSTSGHTPRMISRFRPDCPIAGCCTSKKVCRQLNLSWGVFPMLVKEEYSSEILCLRSAESAKNYGLISNEDTVVFTAGIPLGVPGSTNMIRVSKVSEI